MAKKIGRPTIETEPLTERTALRLSSDDAQQIGQVAAKFPGVEQAAVVRAALRLGLTVLELESSLLVAGLGPAPKRRQALKPYLQRGE